MVIKKTTIVDIAKAAGVSVSTVSRIINNKPDVAEETRRRVLQVIEEHGFAPQFAWQQLRSGKSRLITLHFPQNFNPLPQGIITSAALRCERAGFTLNLLVGPLSENDLLGLFRSGQTDGMILVEILVDDWRVDLLRQHHAPFVMVGRCQNSADLTYVDSDIGTGVMDAVAHLVQLGHRHIGFLTVGLITPEKEFGFTAWARQGYLTACRQFDLPDYSRVADFSTESVMAVAQTLLQQHPEITALVTPQDAGVPGILKAIKAQGLRIPEDISVVGLLDETFAEVITPPLTALNFSSRELGTVAAELLIEQLNHPQLPAQQILIRPELYVRGSTAPPRTTP